MALHNKILESKWFIPVVVCLFMAAIVTVFLWLYPEFNWNTKAIIVGGGAVAYILFLVIHSVDTRNMKRRNWFWALLLFLVAAACIALLWRFLPGADTMTLLLLSQVLVIIMYLFIHKWGEAFARHAHLTDIQIKKNDAMFFTIEAVLIIAAATVYLTGEPKRVTEVADRDRTKESRVDTRRFETTIDSLREALREEKRRSDELAKKAQRKPETKEEVAKRDDRKEPETKTATPPPKKDKDVASKPPKKKGKPSPSFRGPSGTAYSSGKGKPSPSYVPPGGAPTKGRVFRKSSQKTEEKTTDSTVLRYTYFQ